MKWFLKVLKQYADFKSRARRTEYWMFTLFYCIFALVAGIIDGILGLEIGVGALLALALLVPSFAVSVRRLHDIGKSGWNLLFMLLPIVGWILLIVWACKDSQAGENKWGANPKE